MPDIRNGSGRLTRGSREVRFTLFALAIVALVLGAAAFLIAVQANGRNAAQATSDAKMAQQAAERADARAEAADRRAEAAANQVAAVHQNLCTFLNVMRNSKLDESPEAQRLYVLYHCPP